MPALAVLLPWIFTAIKIFLVANLVGFIVRIFAGLGLYFLVLSPVIDTIGALLAGRFGVLPPPVATWVGFFNFDRFFSLWLSGYAIAQSTNFVLRLQRGS